ncbi:MAG: hypothetical protein AAFX44_00055 [Pseudomonadota bacterium]
MNGFEKQHGGNAIHSVAVFLATLFLAACGGGGGGGGTTTPPPPPAPPSDDTTFGTLALTESTVDVLLFGIGGSEGVLQIGQAVIDQVVTLLRRDSSAFQGCSNGSSTAVLNDVDQDFTLSAGDNVTVTFTACDNAVLNGVADGIVEVEIDVVTVAADRVTLVGTLQIPSPLVITDPASMVTVSASGNFDFSYALDEAESLTTSTGAGQSLTLDLEGVIETLTSFTIARTTRFDTEISPGSSTRVADIDIDVRYDSTALGGSFTCNSDDILFVGGSDLPDVATVQCRGLNSSLIEVFSQNIVRVDEDASGDPRVIGELFWNQVIEGFFQEGFAQNLDDFAVDVPGVILPVQAVAAVYDQPRDRILLATANDPVFGNALVELIGGTRSLRSLATLDGEPSLLRVSDDGSRVFVTFAGNDVRVQRHAIETLALEQTVVLQADFDDRGGFEVQELVVSPVDPLEFTVVLASTAIQSVNVVRVVDSQQLPVSYRDFQPSPTVSSIAGIAYASDASRVYVTDTPLILVTAPDGFSGVDELLERLLFGRLRRIGNSIFSTAGAYDSLTLARLGDYPQGGAELALDTVRNRRYTVSSSAPATMDVFSLDEYTRLASYDLGLGIDRAVRTVVAADAFVAVATDRDLLLIDADDLAVRNDDACLAVSLTNADQVAYQALDCLVNGAVYDPTRNKIFAIVDELQGLDGNQILQIDPATLVVEASRFVGSAPFDVELSSAGSTLAVTTLGEDRVPLVSPDNLSIVDSVEFPPVLATTTMILPDREPQRQQRAFASTTNDSGFVITRDALFLSDFIESARFVNNGLVTPDGYFPGNGGRFPRSRIFHFDADGSAYLFAPGQDINGDFDVMIRRFTTSANGLALAEEFTLPINGATEFTDTDEGQLVNGRFFSRDGFVVDLGIREARALFNRQDAIAGEDVFALFVDDAAGRIYALMDGPGVAQFAVAAFDLDTGAFIADAVFPSDGFGGPAFSRSQIFAVGSDSIGVTLGNSGLFVVPVSALN